MLALLFFLFTLISNSRPQALDLFVLAGQSNMAGRGPIPRDPNAIDQSVEVNGISIKKLNQSSMWAPAVHPIHYDRPHEDGVGLALSFAQNIAQNFEGLESNAIGLIPTAVSGTSVVEWDPDTGHCYQEAIRRIDTAFKKNPGSSVRGILWHQGEYDSRQHDTATSHSEHLHHVLESLRSYVVEKNSNKDIVPIITGELGRYIDPHTFPYANIVNEGTRRVAQELPNAAWVTSEDLTHRGDHLHFNTPSLVELGDRYADAYLNIS